MMRSGTGEGHRLRSFLGYTMAGGMVDPARRRAYPRIVPVSM